MILTVEGRTNGRTIPPVIIIIFIIISQANSCRRTGDMRKGCLHADAARIVLKDMSPSPSSILGKVYIQKIKAESLMLEA
jgi:hypothetical protein